MLTSILLLASLLITPVQGDQFEVVAVLRTVDSESRMITAFANGRDRTLLVATEAQILDESGQPLKDGLNSKQLVEGLNVSLTVQRGDRAPTILVLQIGKKSSSTPTRTAQAGKPTTGLQPLNEMSATDRYQGEEGGLYGAGSNEPSPELAAAAAEAAAAIVPRDQTGRPAASGKIGLISISMSNATQEFSRFKQLADRDPQKSPAVQIVDCAQGGQTMARWADPNGNCWREATRRLNAADVSPDQVQAAWIKLANAGPNGDLQSHGRQLERDTREVLKNAKKTFPNLQVAFLSSRIYAGYATTRLNPEPYAYEGGFVVRWLIKAQVQNANDLNDRDTEGEVQAPVLLWGPYLWADGMSARKADGLKWEADDFGNDGTHPSESGRQKVALQLLQFFKTDAHSKTWFLQTAVGRD